MSATRAGVLACVLAALPLGCGGDDSPATTAKAALPAGCERVAAPAPKRVDLEAPKARLPRASRARAIVWTSCGRFTIALDARRSPSTTASFAYLAEKGVYDKTAFHRIVPGFVIQGGDPLGTGRGGPGYFVDEPPPPRFRYVRGTVAMVKSRVEPPGRSGSQFFVVTAADAALAPDYAVLGHVTEGMDVVDRIAKLGDPASGDTGTPLAPVVIERVETRGA